MTADSTGLDCCDEQVGSMEDKVRASQSAGSSPAAHSQPAVGGDGVADSMGAIGAGVNSRAADGASFHEVRDVVEQLRHLVDTVCRERAKWKARSEASSGTGSGSGAPSHPVPEDSDTIVSCAGRQPSEKAVPLACFECTSLEHVCERLECLVKEHSAELLAAQRQLLISEKLASVGQLAAGIAHEINTPIQYVGDNLQALSEYFDDLISLVHQYREVVALARSGEATAEAFDALGAGEEEHDLEYILEDAPNAVAQGLEGVKRVVHIVRAMKDFSHVNRSELSITDINHALENTLTVTRNEYKYVADVETDFGELPQVECYVSDLNQVFLNLLVNAAHAIADTGKRGTITIKTMARGDEVEVRITDTGTGIPEEIRDKVFDPFFTTKEVGQGTGQGLNIVHQIVVGKHRGSVSLETEVGKGTTFCLRIPKQAHPPAEPDEKDE